MLSLLNYFLDTVVRLQRWYLTEVTAVGLIWVLGTESVVV
jgi:hypothetical protein